MIMIELGMGWAVLLGRRGMNMVDDREGKMRGIITKDRGGGVKSMGRGGKGLGRGMGGTMRGTGEYLPRLVAWSGAR